MLKILVSEMQLWLITHMIYHRLRNMYLLKLFGTYADLIRMP